MLEEKIKLLAKAIWTRTDIENYFNVSARTAIKMRDQVILKANGLVPDSDNRVFSSAVIRYYSGNSRSEEMSILKEGVIALEKSNK